MNTAIVIDDGIKMDEIWGEAEPGMLWVRMDTK